jgi:ribosomal 30S subunit maturation factor RimM
LCTADTYAVLSGSFPKRIKISDVNEKGDLLVVSLSGVDTRTGSDALKDADVYVDNTIYRDYLKNTGSIIRLVGYTVVDNKLGNIGVVKSVIRGKQDLIALGDKEEKLIPFVSELVASVDDDNRIINTVLPAGIFEL